VDFGEEEGEELFGGGVEIVGLVIDLAVAVRGDEEDVGAGDGVGLEFRREVEEEFVEAELEGILEESSVGRAPVVGDVLVGFEIVDFDRLSTCRASVELLH